MDAYSPERAPGVMRDRMERGLARRGMVLRWSRDDFPGELALTRLGLKVFDGGVVVREASITYRTERKCEGEVAETLCEDLILGDRRVVEPIRYGS